MNPLLQALLGGGASFLPALLSHLFGSDPQARLRQQLMQLTSPGHMGQMTNQNFAQFQGSPAYTQAQGQIAAGANATQNALARNVGSSGILSGSGALANSITPSIVGGQQSQLNAAGWNQAQNQTQNQIEQQFRALAGTGGPSQSQQLLGTGIDSFLPFLFKLLSQRQTQPGVSG